MRLSTIPRYSVVDMVTFLYGISFAQRLPLLAIYSLSGISGFKVFPDAGKLGGLSPEPLLADCPERDTGLCADGFIKL